MQVGTRKVFDLENSRLSATVHGLVQGVFFRDFTVQQARVLGLQGYVRNLPDGRSLEVIAEGPRPQLEILLKALQVGPPRARVDRVAANWGLARGSFTSFEIRYTSSGS